MYRKQQQTSPTALIFQLKPQIIAIEFDKKIFTRVKDIKNWILLKFAKLGFVVDFNEPSMKDEDDNWYYYQISKIYKSQVQDCRVEYSTGVYLYCHFTEFQIKDEIKIKELLKKSQDLE